MSMTSASLLTIWLQLSTLWIGLAWNFCILLAICFPLEKLFPVRNQKFIRPGWATDCVFYITQHAFLEGFMLSLFTTVAGFITPLACIQFLHERVSHAPYWLQFLAVIIAGDVLGYVYHRGMHGSQWLWPIHAVHHSTEEPDWLSAHREHPIDLILGSFCITLPFILLGVPMALAVPLITFRGFWSLYLHSNINLSIGPLQVLMGSPRLHNWHHSQTHFACNYSNYSPWLDILFGTYYCPPEQPVAFGISEPIPNHYLACICHPFLQIFKQLSTRKHNS